MQFAWSALIDRARTVVDDDHDDTDGWISEAKWLTLANVEYAQLYRRWVRMGLIAPAAVDVSFTGPTTVIGDGESDVLAIVGVAESLGGGQYRPLESAQSQHGRNPWWSVAPASPASHWKATGAGDEITVTIEPPDTATYVVRYIPTVAYATLASATIEVPYGCDERLVLGLARRAKLKDASASALLERLIQEADAEANFLAFGRMNDDSPRVRRGERRDPFGRTPSLYRYF